MNNQWIFWVAMASYALHIMEEFFYDWKNWANHVLPFIRTKKFSPSLFTAIILFFPVGMYSFHLASENGVQLKEMGVAMLTGFLLMAFPIVLLKTRKLPFFSQSGPAEMVK